MLFKWSEWCGGRALAFKTIGRGFAPRQHFVFFTRRRRRRVSIYQSYYGREETKDFLQNPHSTQGQIGSRQLQRSTLTLEKITREINDESMVKFETRDCHESLLFR